MIGTWPDSVYASAVAHRTGHRLRNSPPARLSKWQEDTVLRLFRLASTRATLPRRVTFRWRRPPADVAYGCATREHGTAVVYLSVARERHHRRLGRHVGPLEIFLYS